jgi:VanZ family protein
MTQQVNNWLWAVIVWIGVIFFSSTSLASKWAERAFRALSEVLLGGLSASSSSYGFLHLIADKGFHVTLFCVLAVLLWRTLVHAQNRVWVILIAGAITGSSSELLQRLFPDRDPAPRDVLINVGGTALGIVACIVASRRKQPQAQERNAEPDPVLVD